MSTGLCISLYLFLLFNAGLERPFAAAQGDTVRQLVNHQSDHEGSQQPLYVPLDLPVAPVSLPAIFHQRAAKYRLKRY
jgi:hypothetical protein